MPNKVVVASNAVFITLFEVLKILKINKRKVDIINTENRSIQMGLTTK